MATNVRFSLRAAKRKRRFDDSTNPLIPHTTTRDGKLTGVFLSVEEAAEEAQEAAAREDQASRRPQKAMLLEDSAAKVKRLQAEGNTLAEAERYRAAIGRWQEAVGIDPRNAVLYELLAQGAMAVGDHFDAVQYGLKAVEFAPAWGEAYHTLARCHLNFGELELARDNLKKAQELLGDNEELVTDRREVQKLLEKQREILARRDAEAVGAVDEDKLQVISCMKHLSLRGQVG